MSYAYEHESFTVGNYTVRIVADEDAQHADPRDADNLGVMVLFIDHYAAGDEPYKKTIPEYDDVASMVKWMNSDDYGREYTHHGAAMMARWLRMFYGATVVLPLYAYEGSSGLYVTAGNEDDGRACAGFIFDTPRTREMLGAEQDRVEVERELRVEVDVYRAWTTGQVYGWVVEQTKSCNLGHEHVEVVDSCWGYIVSDWREDFDYIRGEATAAAEAAA